MYKYELVLVPSGSFTNISLPTALFAVYRRSAVILQQLDIE